MHLSGKSWLVRTRNSAPTLLSAFLSGSSSSCQHSRQARYPLVPARSQATWLARACAFVIAS